jgi:cobalt-zinc-cadmium efflux system outer membrane protein
MSNKVARGAGAALALALVAGAGSREAAWAQSATYEELRGQLQSPAAAPTADEDRLFAGAEHLEREAFVKAVLARNPSVEAARAAARAALYEVPQARSLEDPMLMYGIAPISAFDAGSRFGQRVQLEQRFPFPGKLRLRGEVALADALGAREDLTSTTLRLGLAASQLFDDWYVVSRALEINAEHLRLLESFKRSAEAQFVVGKASQQDPLQAEVEIAQLLHEEVVLKAQRAILRARMNSLLRRAPQAGLPSPPKELQISTAAPPPSVELQDQAVRNRPELAALAARIRGRQAGIQLARRNYFPDVGVMGSYNSMWMNAPHQYMVGVTLNLPIYLEKRGAAVEQARAQLTRAEAEQVREMDEIRVEVEQARERLLESLHAVTLFRSRIVPAVQDQVEAARVGFETGRNSFLAVIQAENNLRTIELRFAQVLADVERRRADLDRAVGVIPGLEIQTEGELR